jgi:hypothetical protein
VSEHSQKSYKYGESTHRSGPEMPAKEPQFSDLPLIPWIALGCAVLSGCLFVFGWKLANTAEGGAMGPFLFSGVMSLVGMSLGLISRKAVGVFAALICLGVIGCLLFVALLYYVGSHGHVS